MPSSAFCSPRGCSGLLSLLAAPASLKRSLKKYMKCASILCLAFVWFSIPNNALRGDLAPQAETAPKCEDAVSASATIDKDLDNEFFALTMRSYPWHVVDHGDGRLEDTLDGKIDPEDRIQVEHTANIISDH